METRTSSRQITFRKPFLIRGLDGIQSPGTYTVVTEEEMLDSLFVVGWRQLSLTMIVHGPGGSEHVPLDRQDLDDALARDGDAVVSPPRDRSRSRRGRDLLRRGGRP